MRGNHGQLMVTSVSSLAHVSEFLAYHSGYSALGHPEFSSYQFCVRPVGIARTVLLVLTVLLLPAAVGAHNHQFPTGQFEWLEVVGAATVKHLTKRFESFRHLRLVLSRAISTYVWPFPYAVPEDSNSPM